MAKFDRYMLSQLMVVFGFFSLVLVMVYWINRAVRLFDQLIADGQSAGVFLEFSALSLPAVISIALPLAGFAAAVYVTNRMTQESEMVVVQATGYSPYRLARPVLYFGVIVFALLAILNNVLVPKALSRLDTRTAEIAQNATARLLTPGTFIEAADGVTFYIREMANNGELSDIFLSDTRSAQTHVTYTASRAYLIRSSTDTQLVMVNGMAQTLRTADDQLFTTTFEDFAFNIGSVVQTSAGKTRRSYHVGTFEMASKPQEIAQEFGMTKQDILREMHQRISESFLGLVGALLGFAALIVGGFSRFGVWRQIVIAIFLIIIIKAVETAGVNLARSDPSLWWAVYISSSIGLLIVAALLFMATRPYLFKRTPKNPVVSS